MPPVGMAAWRREPFLSGESSRGMPQGHATRRTDAFATAALHNRPSDNDAGA